MEILEVKNSSAISQISFHKDENLVGVCFNYSPNKEYLFLCEEFEEVKNEIKKTEYAGDSVGKLINSFRKNGSLSVIEV